MVDKYVFCSQFVLVVGICMFLSEKGENLYLSSQEAQTHRFHGRQTRMSQYTYIDASISIDKSKKWNAITTTPFPEGHRRIHTKSSAFAQHQAHGGFFERTMRQHRIIKDPNHPITSSIHRNKYNNDVIALRTNTTQYQNSVLKKSLRIIHDGYVNKCTNPRRIETNTAAYHVEM